MGDDLSCDLKQSRCAAIEVAEPRVVEADLRADLIFEQYEEAHADILCDPDGDSLSGF